MTARVTDALSKLNLSPDAQAVATAGGLAVGAAAAAYAGVKLLRPVGRAASFLHVPGEVDYKCERHGGDLVAETLKAHGVAFVYTLCGGHISPILVACEKNGIEVIDTRIEAAAVFAADATARLTGTIGVAAVTAGPGVTNTVTAAKNAQMAESPLLILGGAASTLQKGRGALQDIEQLSVFQSICKFSASVASVREIVPTLRKAIQIAYSDTPGPVFVEFPIDTLYPIQTVAKEMELPLPGTVAKKGSGKGGLVGKFVHWYLGQSLRQLFGGAFVERPMTPLPPRIDLASDSQIRQVIRMLQHAKSPLVLVGSQAMVNATNTDQLADSLRKLGVPCFLGGMARGLLGRYSDLHIRHKRGMAIKEADLIIKLGMVADFRLKYGRAFHHKTKIVSVNRGHHNISLNTDLFWKPTLPIVGDPSDFMIRLADKTSWEPRPTWIEHLHQRDMEREGKITSDAQQPPVNGQFMNPLALLQIAEEYMAEDAIMVADGGDFVGSAAYIVRPRGPLRWLDPGAFGTLGVGGGFALAAGLVRPESEIWIIFGDGSAGYSLAEFDTYTRLGLKVIALVGNDACWTQIARDQIPRFNSEVACNIGRCAYDTVVEGLGATGFVIEKLKDAKKVFEKAKKAAAVGKPVLINAHIGKSDFREGSISV